MEIPKDGGICAPGLCPEGYKIEVREYVFNIKLPVHQLFSNDLRSRCFPLEKMTQRIFVYYIDLSFIYPAKMSNWRDLA